MNYLIPKYGSAVLRGQYFTNEWYQYFDAVGATASNLDALQAQVSSLQAQVDALPDTEFTITGGQSVAVAGSPSSGNVSLSLQGDSPAPGANKYYATDSLGNKGWYSFVGLTFPQAMSIASLRP